MRCDALLTLIPESFGKTTLDALALGRPVAGYEHGGVGEQLDIFLPQGKVPVGDTAAMAKLLAEWHRQAPTPLSPCPRHTGGRICWRGICGFTELP